MNVVLIDNYDSFTWNVVHAIGKLGARVVVYRNDAITADAVLGLRPDAVVISPGPCTPREAGISLDIIAKARGEVPILGVCLGHQAIGEAYGGRVVRAAVPMHGKLSTVRHGGRGLFRGVNGTFQATRYHSLIVDRASMPDSLEITADTEDGIVMGVSHREHPVHGVQFHPESIACEQGTVVLRNFLELAAAFRGAPVLAPVLMAE